jgi:hypothetical protein
LTNAGRITSATGSIAVSNAASVTVAGGGSLAALQPGQTITMTSTGGGVINFVGGQTFEGAATLSVSGTQVQIVPDAVVSGTADLTLVTPSLANDGTLSSTGGLLRLAGSSGLSVTGFGAMAGSTGLKLEAGGGALNAAQDELSGALDVSGASISVTSGGSLSLSRAVASAGSASFIAGSGALSVLPGALVTVTNGELLLQNNDLATGTIVFGANSSLSVSAGCGRWDAHSHDRHDPVTAVG